MYSEQLERAIQLSLQAHAGQFRKADPHVPYATHPIHVAFLVHDVGGNEETVIAALLHDVLEDTDVTTEDLEEAFGSRVTSIVREVSEDKTLRWELRKGRMVAQLRDASPAACLVAAADKTHNLETLVEAHGRLGPSVWDSFRGRPVPTIRFYAETLEVLRGRIPPRLEAAYESALVAARTVVPPSEEDPV